MRASFKFFENTSPNKIVAFSARHVNLANERTKFWHYFTPWRRYQSDVDYNIVFLLYKRSIFLGDKASLVFIIMDLGFQSIVPLVSDSHNLRPPRAEIVFLVQIFGCRRMSLLFPSPFIQDFEPLFPESACHFLDCMVAYLLVAGFSLDLITSFRVSNSFYLFFHFQIS